MSYERLTKYDGFDRKYHVHHISFQDLVDRLAELEDKIECGDLIELPCIMQNILGDWVVCFYNDEYHTIDGYQLSTKEEAETKLKELKENKHD